MKKIVISLFLSVALVINQPAILYPAVVDHSSQTSNNESKKPKCQPKSYSDNYGMEAELDFYSGDYVNSELILKSLKSKKDRNYALWSNQLGSLYLAEGKKQEAKESFIDAYSLMNDISAFQNLESRALGLSGSEAAKAYKGDPYEKVFNAVYLGLLFYDDNDLDNALACFKNGILCDSDVEGNLYRSDMTIIYLLAARIESIRGNQSMADDYFNKVVEAFYLSHPSNRTIVSEEQALISLLDQKQKELAKIDIYEKERNDPIKDDGEKNKSKQNFSWGSKIENTKTKQKIAELKAEIEKLSGEINKLSDKRQMNNSAIDVSILKNFLSRENNVLLCLELGRGPLKYQIGRHGELAVFTLKPFKAQKAIIMVDNVIKIDENGVLANDVFYQASTRGGRVMDGILKGKAEFKQTTAELSQSFSQASQQISSQANQMVAANPYADASGMYAASAVLSLFSLIMMVSSEMANPAADARHWSFLPAELQIIPLKLSPGKHNIMVNVYDESGNVLDNQSCEFDIYVESNSDTAVFKRIFEGL